MADKTVSNTEEFQDPLENYDPKTFDDPLEQALAEKPVSSIQYTPFTTIPHDMTIREAIIELASKQVSCLLVENEGELIGVFSERDVQNRVALVYDHAKDLPVKEAMTGAPLFVFETDSAAAAFAVMAVSGHRHVPVLTIDHKIAGIISPQRVTEFLLSHSR